MYTVITTKRYTKTLEKLRKQGADLQSLRKVIDLLENNKRLSSKYKDHQLKGEFAQFRELHVKNDLLLVYTKNDTELVLVLVTIGTHGNLFGN